MNKNIEKEFNKQINEEMYSSYLYMAMSAHFESENLKGVANWFKVQAQEEMAHAMKFYGHILERGGRIDFDQIEKPKGSWDSPLEAFQDAYNHEKHITGRIHKLMDLSIEEKDYPSKTMLQWFVDEQVEEEASADDILGKIKLMKDAPGGMYMLDQELAQRVFNPPTEEK